MNGKEKCEMLRSIRMTIAQKYGIEYETKECDHEECATGTCPLCEQEAELIMDELRKRELTGELDKIDIEVFKDPESILPAEDENLLLMGEPVPYEIAYPHGDNLLQTRDNDDDPMTLMGDIAAPDDDQDEDCQEDDELPPPRP